YVLHSKRIQRIIKIYSFGDIIKHASKSLDHINLPLPPITEQKAIAKVLSTVDEAIEKADKIIEKTERLKKGLMKKLLSNKEDTKVKLGEKISLEYGKGLPERERKRGPYPVYGSNGVVGYHSRFLVKGPGIIVGRKGTIGTVVWSEKDFWPIDTTYFVKLKDSKINLKWLYYKLISLNLSRLNMATGTPGLNRALVYVQEIVFPDQTEQQKIAEILSTVDKKLELERKRKEKLERIKKGLMNDLLTGRKRVDVKKILGGRFGE
ncbi:MAG: restriction endonuclease subunit S, partial [Nanoarchaeota archaeon]|nr:restriction endonuclease subunit S [Nanoarchaeota archaeon]